MSTNISGDLKLAPYPGGEIAGASPQNVPTPKSSTQPPDDEVVAFRVGVDSTTGRRRLFPVCRWELPEQPDALLERLVSDGSAAHVCDFIHEVGAGSNAELILKEELHKRAGGSWEQLCQKWWGRTSSTVRYWRNAAGIYRKIYRSPFQPENYGHLLALGRVLPERVEDTWDGCVSEIGPHNLTAKDIQTWAERNNTLKPKKSRAIIPPTNHPQCAGPECPVIGNWSDAILACGGLEDLITKGNPPPALAVVQRLRLFLELQRDAGSLEKCEENSHSDKQQGLLMPRPVQLCLFA